MQRFILFLVVTWVAFGLSFTSFADEQADENAVKATARLLPFDIEPTQNVALEIELEVAEGYSTYAEMYELTLKTPNSGFKLGKFYINPIQSFYDATTKKTREGVVGKATLKAPLEAPEILSLNEDKLEFFLTYQACTKTYCLFPKTIDVTAYFNWKGQKEVTGDSKKLPSSPSFLSSIRSLNIKELYKTQGTLFILLALFALGVLTSFTPCVYPLIPITLAVLGREAHARNKRQNFFAANIYVIGMSLTYAGLGVLAASSGLLFGSYMTSPWVLSVVCLVFLTMSLSSFGLFEIQLPARFQIALQSKSAGGGYFKIFFTGMVAGLIAGPCVGPILVGVLTFISQTQNLWLGFWSLFSFSIGMGQILLLIGLSGGVLKLLPKSGAWMNSVKNVFGILLLGMFFYYLEMLLPNRIWEGALGLGLIILGGYFHFSQERRESPLAFVGRALSLASLLFGVFLLFWATMNLSQKISSSGILKQNTSILNDAETTLKYWDNYTDQSYQAALKSGKPIILDFYADWCAACHELETKTFNDPKFIELTKNFNLIQFDATKESKELQLLKKKYNIVGLPTLIFYNKNGKVQPNLTVNEFLTSDQFEPILKQLL